MYFGGVEGGATHSNLVICNEKGQVLGRSTGPETNHWSCGIDGCAERLITMLHAAKKNAGIPLDVPLDALGLTLSGCEQESSNAELAACVKQKDAYSAKAIYVGSDTIGSLATGAPGGGMVIIASTGSNAVFQSMNGEKYQCGGWGHLLGDEGGAYWIAHKAVKTVFDDFDGLQSSPHPINAVWETVQNHFGVKSQADLLPHSYKHFNKPFFANLTTKLAQLAILGDPLSQYLFAEAGSALASHAAALIKHAKVDKIRVVCVGSVWKSWELLKPGALRELRLREINTELELVRLKVSSAMGAAWLAAKHINFNLPRDDNEFCEIFYTYQPNEHTQNGHSEKRNGEITFQNGDYKFGNKMQNLNGVAVNGIENHDCSEPVSLS